MIYQILMKKEEEEETACEGIDILISIILFFLKSHVDLVYIDNPFTWYNIRKDERAIFSLLDLVLVNHQWINYILMQL